ncbi:hypothetical protein [Bacillus sp. REN3]|uniref:hypothetical protein n=1 Tax=Bacillus sp. REN3 TaxID=2802440 RepID=UPI001FF0417E|nr:hypothetical protein [Bacillus sp. REN3]
MEEEKYLLAKRYSDLLETVEEGFEYIAKSFENLAYTEGDRLLDDIFTAFSQIIQTNFLLAEFYKENAPLLKTLALFEAVVHEAEKLDGKFGDPSAKQEIILEQLYPAFSAWKQMVGKELNPYIHV